MKKEDLYIFSLDCTRNLESIGVIGNTISYLEEQKNTFSNPETLTYSDAFDAHFDQIIDHCKHALLRFRQTINENYPHILLTFNVREFWDSEERAEIFQAINDENASKEYSEHIEDFA